MQEVLEQLLDYLKGIWIKRRYIMISTWLICPIAWYFISTMPNVYESKARVYVDTQSLLGPLLRGLTVETNPEIQIRLMVKTLLSRPNLERIARMTDLDIQAENPEEFDEIINGLKANLKINTAGRENIYTLSIEDKDPELAKSIVQAALNVFIENTLGESRNDSDSAQKFINTQIDDYEERLSASESKLASFKQRYSDVLPGKNGGYYTKLSISKERLKTIELELLESKTKLNTIKNQLVNSAKVRSPSQNKIKSNNTIETTYDNRINELESTLDTLQLRYTEMHPDVKELKKQLVHLNDMRSKEIENYISSSDNDNGGNLSQSSQNPVIQELQIQMNELTNSIASLEVRKNTYKTEVTELESKIHTLPEIEAELTALNRGYNITKQKYDELLRRRETALLAQQADATTDKIQFRVIDPPRTPKDPVGPKKTLFFILITIVGAAIGAGLSFLTSQINPIVTSASQVSKATGFPVFGVIAATENIGLQQWHKRKTVIFVLSNLLLLFVLIGFVAMNLFPDAILEPIKRVL